MNNKDGILYPGTKVETPETDKGKPKLMNQTSNKTAETLEGRGLTEGNPSQGNTRQTQSWESVHSELRRVHRKAKTEKKIKFTALMHHIYNLETLREAYESLKRDAAPGVDKETWKSYRGQLERNLEKLSENLKRGAYRAKPVKRAYIPKADGTARPLGITTLEDKIVQKATVEVMNAIYEADFLGFSYGFRPEKSQHKALDALTSAITTRKVGWIFDVDLKNYFNSINQEWLLKFIQHRIADKRLLKLIQKWLKSGVLENGKVEVSEEGVPQGGAASPLLANIYLHYVYDLWVQQWRTHKAKGEMIVVRYADDILVGFQYQRDAERFRKELTERLKKFGLEMNPEKTRLLEFGRYAEEERGKRGQGKPASFNFLGFTHSCGKTKEGKFKVIRQTIKKRMRKKVEEVKASLKRRMHRPIKETGEWLNKVLRGHYQYYGVPGNYEALKQFRYLLGRRWKRTLDKRSQKATLTWEKMKRYIDRWFPKPKIYHPYPLERFLCLTQGKSLMREIRP